MDLPAPGASDDREFRHARLLDAPRERVFRALSDPARLARWWGPFGFTNAISEFDFRPGGNFRLVMEGPDGARYPNHWVFREIVEPERLVLEHLDEAHHFFLAITLKEDFGRTRVGWRQVFDTVAHRDRIAPIVEAANEQNLDRLAAEVRQAG